VGDGVFEVTLVVALPDNHANVTSGLICI
jgi:hypothetical protein